MLSLLDDASEDLREKKRNFCLNPSSYKILYPQKWKAPGYAGVLFPGFFEHSISPMPLKSIQEKNFKTTGFDYQFN